MLIGASVVALLADAWAGSQVTQRMIDTADVRAQTAERAAQQKASGDSSAPIT